MSIRAPGTNSMRRRLDFLWHAVAGALKQPAPATWSVVDPGASEDFEGQVVVITGAAGGVGGPLVDAFAAAGATVHALDKNIDDLAELSEAREGLAWAHRVHDGRLDLDDSSSIARFVSSVTAIDVLVNNAGHNDRISDFGEVTAETLRSMLEANVVGPTALTAGLTEALCDGGSGSVVFVTSIHSSRSSRWVQYGMAKGALRKLTIDAAGALAERGVRVNAVAPGWTFDHGADPDERSAPRQLLGASTVPIEAVVHAVMFLADRHRSPMTTGQELVVDGGALLSPRR